MKRRDDCQSRMEHRVCVEYMDSISSRKQLEFLQSHKMSSSKIKFFLEGSLSINLCVQYCVN